MKVRMRSTAAGPWGLLLAGNVGEVPDGVGRAMVAAGAAVDAGDGLVEVVIPPPVTQAATAEASEAAVMDPPRRRKKHATVQERGVPA